MLCYMCVLMFMCLVNVRVGFVIELLCDVVWLVLDVLSDVVWLVFCVDVCVYSCDVEYVCAFCVCFVVCVCDVA